MAETPYTYFPGAAALADVELLLHGAYEPVTGFMGADDARHVRERRRLADGTPWPVPVVLHVPDEVATACPPGDSLLVVDAEGAPVACLQVDERWEDRASPGAGPPTWALAGPVAPRGELERGPFRELRHRAADTRRTLAGAATLGVPLDGPLHRADVAGLVTLAGGDTVLLMPLLDAEPDGLDPTRLVRATVAAAAEVPGALVVPVPWARRRDDAEGEAMLRAHVAGAYGATRVVQPGATGLATAADLPVPVAEPTPVGPRLTDSEVQALLDVGRPLPEGHTAPGVERELRAAYPPRHRRGFTVFFTGLSGSGKSTVAHRLAESLAEHTLRTVTLLDGDLVRRMLSSGLGFSKADRDLNIRRIGWVAAEVSRHGGVAICAPIAPYARTRADVRRMVEATGEFVLVYVATPLEECERRDRKGLYAKARRGEIREFTGISDPYEAPDDADLVLDTTDVPVDDCAEQVLALLVERGLVRLDG